MSLPRRPAVSSEEYHRLLLISSWSLSRIPSSPERKRSAGVSMSFALLNISESHFTKQMENKVQTRGRVKEITSFILDKEECVLITTHGNETEEK